MSARSTKDFINKLKIVEEELDETIYWLEILVEAEIVKEAKVSALMQEGSELFKIVTRSLKTLRAKIEDKKSVNK